MRTFLGVAIGLVASIAIGQNYEFVERTGQATASATIAGGQLTILESTGERVVFRRESRYDSPDGQMLGFYNADLQRVLRFPRSGVGAMHVADLDQPNPRFQQTQRTVRPATGRGFGQADPFGKRLETELTPGYGSGFATVPNAYSFPYVTGYRSAYPQSLLIESNIVASPLLQPATLTLANSGRRELLVTITDLKSRQQRSLRIPPGRSAQAQFKRDAGGKRVAKYQTVGPLGDAAVREVVTEIRPTIRYELTVHEYVMQSIAIDRTGKSPSVIEDVNFQGKGLGRFTLPPGSKLRSGTLDVFRTAISVGNAGTVGTIPAQEKPIGNGLSPLERAVRDLQR